MKPKWSTAAAICALTSLLVIGLQLKSLSDTRLWLNERIAYRNQIGSQVRRYTRLSAEQQDTLYGAKPRADLERRMGEALRLSGIVPAPAYALSVQSDKTLQTPGLGGVIGLREQHVSLRLPELPLERIGSLLDYWRLEQIIWRPERIELSHDARSKSNAYALKLDCVAVYHASGVHE